MKQLDSANFVANHWNLQRAADYEWIGAETHEKNEKRKKKHQTKMTDKKKFT